jgi:CRISPR-associated protein Cas2
MSMYMSSIDTCSTVHALFLIINFASIMLLISYDIASDKVRTKFAKYIRKFGRRVQYSVYEIHNSERVIDNIIVEIEANYEPLFSKSDSIMIIPIS